MTKKILIITSFVPDKNNRGGPTGLIYECIQALKMSGDSIELKIINNHSPLNKLGIYFRKFQHEKKFDLILVYPFNLFFYLNLKCKQNIFVLGPDSPSLLFYRLFKNANQILSKLKYYFIFIWLKYKEQKLLRYVNSYIVVGNNDKRWLRILNKNYKEKIKYLTHPILSSIIEDNAISEDEIYHKKSLIFSGDLSIKYTGKYIEDFSSILNLIKFPIIVVGEKNKWIYELFSHLKKDEIYFTEYLEHYNFICNQNYHIHIIPLQNGAGTKNRVLTACAKGVKIISTFIGLENILYNSPPNEIFEFKKVNDIVEILNNISLSRVVSESELDNYIKRVNDKFQEELLNYLNK